MVVLSYLYMNWLSVFCILIAWCCRIVRDL